MEDEKLASIYALFRKYPDVFGGGYLRFLKNGLRQTLSGQEYYWRDGVFLSWHVYKRKVGQYARPGDILLKQLVSECPGNGKAAEVFSDFLRDVVGGRKCLVKVLSRNLRAKAFYRRYGFKTIYSAPETKINGTDICQLTSSTTT